VAPASQKPRGFRFTALGTTYLKWTIPNLRFEFSVSNDACSERRRKKLTKDGTGTS
jgi:hypothetical protein